MAQREYRVVPAGAEITPSTVPPGKSRSESPGASRPGFPASSTGTGTPPPRCPSSAAPHAWHSNTSSTSVGRSACATTVIVWGSSATWSASTQVTVCPVVALMGPGENRNVLWISALGTNCSPPRTATVKGLALAPPPATTAKVMATATIATLRISASLSVHPPPTGGSGRESLMRAAGREVGGNQPFGGGLDWQRTCTPPAPQLPNPVCG